MDGFIDHDYMEMMDLLYDEGDIRISKRYIRDRENPLEFYSNEEFYRRYRFSKAVFMIGIMPLVDIEVHNKNRGLPIPKLLQVLVALRFYATGDFQLVLGDLRGLSQSSVSRIVKNVSVAIASKMKHHVKFPGAEELELFKAQFNQLGNFPGVIGIIDCTHVPIKNPGGQFGELYRNRKGWISLNVQLICGPKMEILDVVSRWPGSTHDSRIFRNSAIKMRFENGGLHGLLLGDSGYPQLPYLFTPILDHLIRNAPERRYNVAHRKTRIVIERTNGVLKQRFQCLRRKLQIKMRTTQAVIVACIVLHNIGMRHGEIPQLEEEENLVPVPNAIHNHPRGNVIRAQFIERHFY